MSVCKLAHETSREYRARWMREWRAANPEKRNDSQYKWRINNPEKFKASHSKWLEKRLEKDPSYWKNKQRRSNGLPEPSRPETTICEICNLAESAKGRTGKIKSLSLDHCHQSGIFRGWLCTRCNNVLGRAGDSSELLRSMAEYLDRSKQ